MTDNNDDEFEVEEAQTPDLTSYQIRASRLYETDFAEQQVQALMQQTGADTAEEAIQQFLMQQETQNIEPDEKLMAVDIQVDEASDS